MGHHVAVTGLQDGVGVRMEMERMAQLLLSHSVSLGCESWSPVSACYHRAASFLLSLFLSLSLITHFLVQTVYLPGIGLVSSAAHDAAVISVDTGSISFTASSITSITCAITSAHFPDGDFSVSGWLAAASVTWLEVASSAEAAS